MSVCYDSDVCPLPSGVLMMSVRECTKFSHIAFICIQASESIKQNMMI